MKLDLEKVRPVQTYVAYGTGGPRNGSFFRWANKWYTYPIREQNDVWTASIGYFNSSGSFEQGVDQLIVWLGNCKQGG
jgi:hypothetical protein